MVGSVSLSTTFGLPIKPADDPYIKLSSTGAEGLKQATVPGAFLVDAFPFMKHFPSWVGFQRKARMWRDDMRAMLDIPFGDSKKQWENRGKVFPYSCRVPTSLSDEHGRIKPTMGLFLSFLKR